MFVDLIFIGYRSFDNVAWVELDHISLVKPILTTFLLGVMLGLDFLGAARHGCDNHMIESELL